MLIEIEPPRWPDWARAIRVPADPLTGVLPAIKAVQLPDIQLPDASRFDLHAVATAFAGEVKAAADRLAAVAGELGRWYVSSAPPGSSYATISCLAGGIDSLLAPDPRVPPPLTPEQVERVQRALQFDLPRNPEAKRLERAIIETLSARGRRRALLDLSRFRDLCLHLAAVLLASDQELLSRQPAATKCVRSRPPPSMKRLCVGASHQSIVRRV